MSTQIFKSKIENKLLFDLLDQICIKVDNYYIFNNSSFKKGQYTNNIQMFINECIPYYHISKRKYLEKKITQKSFVTILRQICNFNNIRYISKIIYNKSTYDVVYYIYF
jgi:hypothetical protein